MFSSSSELEMSLILSNLSSFSTILNLFYSNLSWISINLLAFLIFWIFDFVYWYYLFANSTSPGSEVPIYFFDIICFLFIIINDSASLDIEILDS